MNICATLLKVFMVKGKCVLVVMVCTWVLMLGQVACAQDDQKKTKTKSYHCEGAAGARRQALSPQVVHSQKNNIAVKKQKGNENKEGN